MHEFDEVSDEEAEGKIFEPGQGILITLEEGNAAGYFIGLSDFGLVYRATHRMTNVTDYISERAVNELLLRFGMKTKQELVDYAASELDMELPLGAKKKELVAEIVQALVDGAESQLVSRKEFVELKRTIMTFLPWHEIRGIESSDEHMEEKELRVFGDSLEEGLKLDENDSVVFPGSS